MSYIMYRQCGYLLNQVLYTRLLICTDDLLKVVTASLVYLLWHVTFLPLPKILGEVAFLTDGSSTIPNQSILVRHMKSILDPSLPVSVYGPLRLTHNAFHGIIMTSLGVTWLYFWQCLLYFWQDLQSLTYDWMVLPILSITSQISSSLQVKSAQGVGGNDGTNWQPYAVEMWEWLVYHFCIKTLVCQERFWN